MAASGIQPRFWLILIKPYTDQALTPVSETELEALEMFSASEAAKTAVEKVRKDNRVRARVVG